MTTLTFEQINALSPAEIKNLAERGILQLMVANPSDQINALSPAEIKNLAERGILRLMPTNPYVTITMPKEDLPEYVRHRHLAGVGISMSEAARKYDLLHSTIRGWVHTGIIKRLGAERNRVLIDEADVAYAAEVYHAARKERGGAKRGRWLFNADGTPHIRTTIRRDRP